MSEAELRWPAPTYPTREEAIAIAVADSEPGDTVLVHAVSCATKRNQDCDCSPEVIVVPEARA